MGEDVQDELGPIDSGHPGGVLEGPGLSRSQVHVEHRHFRPLPHALQHNLLELASSHHGPGVYPTSFLPDLPGNGQPSRPNQLQGLLVPVVILLRPHHQGPLLIHGPG